MEEDIKQVSREELEKIKEYIIQQRDIIMDYIHQVKEINEDYLLLERTSLETLKQIYEMLGD